MRIRTLYKINSSSNSVLPGLGLIFLSVFILILERFELIKSIYTLIEVCMIVPIGIFLYKEFSKSREHTLSYFYQIFYFIGLLLSAIMIGSGAYMIEIQKVGTSNGVFLILLIFFVSGLEASRIAYYWGQRKFAKSKSPKIARGISSAVIFAIISVAMLFSLFVLFRYSSPLFLNIDRGVFWRTIVPSTFAFIPTFVLQTFFLALALYWHRKEKTDGRKLPIFIIGLYLFVTVLVLGQKASAFIIFGMVGLFFLSAHNPYFRIKSRIYFYLALIVFSLYFLISFSYSTLDRDDEFILIRVALQSQLIWSVFDYPEFPWFPQVSWLCFWGCNSASTGADFISFMYLPTSVFYHYKESGSGLSGFLPALPILTFGFPVALLLHMLFSSFSGVIQAYLVNQIRNNNSIYAFLVFKIHFALILYWYTANHSVVFGFGFFLSCLLCMSLLLAPSSSRNNKLVINDKRYA